MATRRVSRLVREGSYVAEVEVELLEDDHPWAPYLSPQDLQELDAARLARRRGDLKAAAQVGRVYELKPLAEK